ncbi:DUF2336 domain-containing protein [Magnetospirillum sp. UT-4]|uniref:DUF2336 domain-containing protein n=1 Tax=Magnetospirillum sp. UT-4 TaxID=2681467 RepID=UPI0013845150|nr:DUF2336 domain-containing protein [Magnetospirillum sp. UT-4]CAA7611513.1 conserved hypothetical protein [Magnetospirillum sp. UT-4]
MVVGILKRLLGSNRNVGYEEARELAAHADPQVRAELAGRRDLRPEILYFLAEDDNAEVRRQVAANHQTPPQGNLLLAGDRDEAVRSDLAGKIARLAPGLTAHEQDRLRRTTYEAIEMLARDSLPKVREILAQALKDVADAPPEVIRRLARDVEIAVAGPVLQFSPVLTDEDLLEIIEGGPIPGALAAISQRAQVNVRVADAIAATEDIDAIAVLLGNASAQIREETLDRLIDRAVDIEDWHKPLVSRPVLPAKAAVKLARFVAANLLQTLAERNDLDRESTVAVAAAVRRRLDEMELGGPAKAEAKKAADDSAAMVRARQLHAEDRLDESTIDAALAGNELAFVTAALAVLADLPVGVLRKTIQTQSAKGIVAITWKAGLSMSLCVQLQAKLLRLPQARIVRGREGAFPLTPDEMVWQLEFLSE